MVYTAMKDTGIIKQLFHPDIYAPCKNKACIPFLSGTQAFP